MEKLKEILKNYLYNGGDRIDVTMVLALINQCRKDTKEQLLLHNVSQQRELLKDYTKWLNDKIRDEDDLNELIDNYFDSL